jgi:membrane-associated phospholipid phosphatase
VTWPWWTPRRRTFARLLFQLVWCVCAFGFVYWFTVQTITGRRLADAALRGAELTRSPAAVSVEATLDVVSATALIAAVATIAVVALIRMRRTSGLVAIGLLIAANISGRILKVYVLPRHDLGLAESAPVTLNSLPSGHTTAAFSIGVAALFVVPPVLRRVTATLGILFSSAVAIATMSAGWHRAADSLASFFLVTAWAAIAGVVILLAEPGFTPGGWAANGAHRAGRWWAAAATGLTLVAAVIVAVLVADPEVRESVVGPPAAFVAGALLIVGTAAAMTVVVLRAVSRVSDTGPDGSQSSPAPADDRPA